MSPQDTRNRQPSYLRWGDRFSKPLTVLALVFVVAGLGFAFGRAYKDYSHLDDQFNWGARGLSDLHSCYVYAKTFRHGLSPYEVQEAEEFKTSRPSAPFSPLVFFLLWPISYLTLAGADVVFSFINIAMLGLLSYWVFLFSKQPFGWHWWLAVLGFLIFSRPGHITLYTGYFTPVLVIGTLMALHYGHSRPLLAAVGVLLASAKPTYIIPLLLLLGYRKNFKAALLGTVFSGAVAVAGLLWLSADSSLPEIVDSILVGQKAFDDDPTEFPINTWTRIDVVGMVAKGFDWIPDNKIYLGCMMLLLVPPGMVIRRAAGREHDRGAMGLTAVIAMLALLVTLYHHSYDCLLIAPATMAMILFGGTVLVELPNVARRVVAALLLVPSVNYLSTLSVRDKFGLDQYGVLWQSITMVNGICLTLSLLIVMFYGWRYYAVAQSASTVAVDAAGAAATNKASASV